MVGNRLTTSHVSFPLFNQPCARPPATIFKERLFSSRDQTGNASLSKPAWNLKYQLLLRLPGFPQRVFLCAVTRTMNGRVTSPGVHQSHPANFRCSLTESLEQLATASQKIADLAGKALGLNDGEGGDAARRNEAETPNVEAARQTLLRIFDAGGIDGYDNSESMEKARIAHFNAALEMYIVVAEDPLSAENGPLTQPGEGDLASRIGRALFRELMEYYRATQRVNDRVTFTTEQRTALESAFLLKPKLNIAEKRALAKTCNLNARQVEVWVRARLFTGLINLPVFQSPYPEETRRKEVSTASSGKE